MLKIDFTNARVEDSGYGISINGRELAEIISTALGTRVDGKHGYSSGLPNFRSNCCNVTVIIDPQPVGETIETEDGFWYSVEDMEASKREQYKAKAGEAES